MHHYGLSMNKRNILLTPGPTPLPPEVLAELARPMIHHRTSEYRTIFKEVSDRLKDVFRTLRDVYVFTASGTGAMEASVGNFLSPGDPVLVLASGKFGERFCEIAEAYGLACDCLRVPYGESISVSQVEQALLKKSYRAVYATLSETSTGVLNPIEGLGRAVSKTDAFFAVDAISGLAADRLETDAWHVDLAIGGSQKGLMVPPGLAFLSVSDKAKRAITQAKLPRYYFDLALYKKALGDQDSPFTPAVNLVMGLRAALILISRKGMEAIWRSAERIADATRSAACALGLELFAKTPSNGVTAIRIPAGVDAGKMLTLLQDDYGVVMAGGQAELKGKIFRIAHMGYISEDDLAYGFECLERVLEKMGYGLDKGASVDQFRLKVRP